MYEHTNHTKIQLYVHEPRTKDLLKMIGSKYCLYFNPTVNKIYPVGIAVQARFYHEQNVHVDQNNAQISKCSKSNRHLASQLHSNHQRMSYVNLYPRLEEPKHNK